ncbi:unnamed protein product [Rangifer tarandus platyrhynchus]|uniref:Uncharacterized protein n=2 Tax=Rangifer tarandus platyrhynchus TaxID=3082113 RepID=A0ACB0EFQ4_RANTA|nr:unnamed protein product [Rangifer tarandus platyrhynchus]CAI9699204.1 unnamed protein product [Rangifer tarandus platyrhynchus]
MRIALGCSRSAPRRLAGLQDLGDERARCSFPPLFWLSLLLPSFSFTFLLPGLPYRGRRLLPPRCLSGSPRDTRRQRREQVGEGPGAIAGFSLGRGGGGGSNGGAGGGRGSSKRATTELVGDLALDLIGSPEFWAFSGSGNDPDRSYEACRAQR